MTVISGEEQGKEGLNKSQIFADIFYGMGPEKEPTNEGSPARLGAL